MSPGEDLAAWRDVMSEALAEMDAVDTGGDREQADKIAELLAQQGRIEASLRKIESESGTNAGSVLSYTKRAHSLIVAGWLVATKLRELGHTGNAANVDAFERAAALMRQVVNDETENKKHRHAKRHTGPGPADLAP